jgi:hypothetical protein
VNKPQDTSFRGILPYLVNKITKNGGIRNPSFALP